MAIRCRSATLERTVHPADWCLGELAGTARRVEMQLLRAEMAGEVELAVREVPASGVREETAAMAGAVGASKENLVVLAEREGMAWAGKAVMGPRAATEWALKGVAETVGTLVKVETVLVAPAEPAAAEAPEARPVPAGPSATPVKGLVARRALLAMADRVRRTTEHPVLRG